MSVQSVEQSSDANRRPVNEESSSNTQLPEHHQAPELSKTEHSTQTTHSSHHGHGAHRHHHGGRHHHHHHADEAELRKYCLVPHTAYKYDTATANWIEFVGDIDSTHYTERLTFITFNVWKGSHMAKERSDAIVQILRDSNADVIALQEVRPAVWQWLLSEDWVQKQYYASDSAHATTIGGAYGVVMLSKYPFHEVSIHDLPSTLNRKFLLAEFSFHGHKFRVATAHLESENDAISTRIQQMERIFPLLKGAHHSVFLGDFNFAPEHPENEKMDESFVDVWALLKPDDPGFTKNTTVNKMAANLKKSHHVRLDRVLVNTTPSPVVPRPASTNGTTTNTQDQSTPKEVEWIALWKPVHIELLGDTPISDNTHLFPSDHFGLLAVLEITNLQG